LKQGQVPFLALGAAFSFVIMMFNIPIPGGSSGHAWSAPVPDYTLKLWEGKGLARSSLGYILSAGLGVGIIVLATFLSGNVLRKKRDK
jgi:ABC-type Co2+ transport system permease subunit